MTKRSVPREDLNGSNNIRRARNGLKIIDCRNFISAENDWVDKEFETPTNLPAIIAVETLSHLSKDVVRTRSLKFRIIEDSESASTIVVSCFTKSVDLRIAGDRISLWGSLCSLDVDLDLNDPGSIGRIAGLLSDSILEGVDRQAAAVTRQLEWSLELEKYKL